MNIACSFFLRALRAFVMRALEKTPKREQATQEHCYEYCVQFLSVRVASICNACTEKKLASTSKLLGSIAINIACSRFLRVCICKV